MTRRCPTCGRPMPELRSGVELPRVKARILSMVMRHPGINADDLADWLYGNDINGGPDGGRKTVHVHINQINRLLKLAGESIRLRGGKYTGYQLVQAD